MSYLMPSGGVADIRAAVALGGCWSFTVCQPGLGIVTRVSVGGLNDGNDGGKEGRKEGRTEQGSKATHSKASVGGRVLYRQSKDGRSVVYIPTQQEGYFVSG